MKNYYQKEIETASREDRPYSSSERSSVTLAASRPVERQTQSRSQPRSSATVISLCDMVWLAFRSLDSVRPPPAAAPLLSGVGPQAAR